MADPTNPGGSVPPGGSSSPRGQQDTVLLSDAPQPAPVDTVIAPPSQFSIPNLSSIALAALSQRYDILGEAGHGSMGNVYKARDRETGETVALKLLKPEIASDQAMMDRFKNELLFARKITHKNVCRVHEFNRVGGVAYTSMEFVEGESLRSVLNRFGGLPQRKAVDLALQICSGLKEAHIQGIVHRDLKPENIMIDANGNVKIMDFGIARSMEAVTRMTGSMVGTPQYMAPEQVGGKPIDYRTDIYSLGLMLYEMFTGTPAFQADNPVAVALKQMREEPTPPHDIDPSIPAWIERAILKCIEKDPAKRFQSIAELEANISGNAGTHAPQAVTVPHRPTGSTGLQAATADLSAVRASHTTTAMPPGAMKPTPRKASTVIVGLLLGAVVVFGAIGGSRMMVNAGVADRISAPQELPAPKPPDFAYDSATPVPQPAIIVPAKPNPAPAEDTDSPRAEEKAPAADTKPSSPPEVFPRMETGPVNKRKGGGQAEEILRRDEESEAEPRRKSKPDAAASTAEAAAEGGAAYLYVVRYGKEDRAQEAAKKIEDLGLPAGVATRKGLAGSFYVVYSGPFLQKNAASAMELLEQHGFSNVHLVSLPTAGGNPNQ
jgi:hypothetical protein